MLRIALSWTRINGSYSFKKNFAHGYENRYYSVMYLHKKLHRQCANIHKNLTECY